MTLEPGDVVLVPFPFSDLTEAKPRPAFVLSKASYNGASLDVIVCAMTSNLTPVPHSLPLDNQNLAQGALRARTRVRVNKIASLKQSLIHRVIGRADRRTIRRVLTELRALFPAA